MTGSFFLHNRPSIGRARNWMEIEVRRDLYAKPHSTRLPDGPGFTLNRLQVPVKRRDFEMLLAETVRDASTIRSCPAVPPFASPPTPQVKNLSVSRLIW